MKRISGGYLKNAFVIYYPLLIYVIYDLLFVSFTAFITENDALKLAYFLLFGNKVGSYFTAIVFYSIFLLLFAIFNRTKHSITFLCLSECLFSIITFVKVTYIEEPFNFSDFSFVGNMDEIMSFTGSSSPTSIPVLIGFIIVCLILTGFLIFIGYKTNKSIKNIYLRIGVGIIALIACIILIFPSNSLRDKLIDKMYPAGDYNFGLAIRPYNIYGHNSGIYRNYLVSKNYKPSNMDVDALQKELDDSPIEKDTSLGKPNILVYFSESYWDASQLEDVKFNIDVSKNYNKYKKEGLFFDMVSPTYGGRSGNIEYEFLTGGTLTYYGLEFVPYMSFYRNHYYYDSPSIIRELKNNGYKTYITAFSSPKLFDCGRFYKFAGVDQVDFLEPETLDQSAFRGPYVSDTYAVDKMIEKMNNKKKGEPIFDMVLTLETHYPYKPNKYDHYDVEIVESPYDDSTNDVLRTYAQGIYNVDQELERLYKYIKKLKEPTILVFYGDHLPYFQRLDRTNAISDLAYFNTTNTNLNIFRQYNTQALVLTNFKIDKLKKDNKTTKYLSPDLLSSYLINHMDITVSGYYRWLYSTRNVIGASNHLISVNQNGDIYKNEELTGDMKTAYDKRAQMQYYQFIK